MALFYYWLVSCFGLHGPLRQYFSYIGPSPREREKEMRGKMSTQPPPAPTAGAIGPCPIVIQISRTPRHWKFTQHLALPDYPLFYHYFLRWRISISLDCCRIIPLKKKKKKQELFSLRFSCFIYLFIYSFALRC